MFSLSIAPTECKSVKRKGISSVGFPISDFVFANIYIFSFFKIFFKTGLIEFGLLKNFDCDEVQRNTEHEERCHTYFKSYQLIWPQRKKK